MNRLLMCISELCFCCTAVYDKLCFIVVLNPVLGMICNVE